MILVTGGSGLVGSALLFDLASRGMTVRALRRENSGWDVFNRAFRENPDLKKHIQWVEGNVNDIFSLTEAWDGITEVYHAAGLISFVPSEFRDLMKVNMEGTANVVNISLENKVSKFCHISSVAALGRIDETQNINEEAVWKTSSRNSGYAISKYGAEREVWRGIEEGLNAVIVNPTIVLGCGNWNSGSSGLFSQVWNGLHFYTEGITGFVDVRDVSRCSIALMDKEIFGQRFILNSENLSYHHILNTISEFLGKKKPTIKASPALTALAWRLSSAAGLFTSKRSLITKETARNSLYKWYYSNDKVRQELGIDFIPVRKSIEDICKVFLKYMNLKVVSK